MKFLKFREKRSLFFSWLLSYFIILFITISICAFAYNRALDEIEVEINKAHVSSLKQLKHIVDLKFLNIERIGTKLDNNNRLLNMMYYKGDFDTTRRLKLLDIIDDIEAFNISEPLIDNIYIYLYNTDTIITQNAKFSARDYYELYDKEPNCSYKKWKEVLSDKHLKTYCITENKAEYGENIAKISYYQSMPIIEDENRMATFVVKVGRDRINQLIKRVNWLDESSILIVDRNNNIIASHGELNHTVDYSKLKERSHVYEQTIDDENVVITHIASEIAEWEYISILPKKVFLQRVKQVRDMIIISIIVCLVIGIAISVVFAKMNYNPVHKIIQLFKENKSTNSYECNNEYRYIQKSIAQIINKDKEIHEKLSKHTELLRNNFLYRLLKGRIEPLGNSNDYQSKYDMKLDSNQFAVITYYLEDYSSITDEEIKSPRQARKDLTLAYFILTNVIDEVVGDKYNCYTLEVDNVLASIINFKDSDTENNSRSLLDIAYGVKGFMENKVEMIIDISISAIHDSLDEVFIAYNETMQALEYKVLLGVNQVIRYDALSKSTDNISYHNYLDQKRIFENSVQAGDYDNAKLALSKILDAKDDIHIIKIKMVGLIETIIDITYEFYDKKSLKFDSKELIEELINSETIIQLQNNMNNILDAMDEYNRQQIINTHNDNIKQIINLLKSNYTDVNLSVSRVADILGKDPAYLTRLFKRETGKSILEYIHNFRIEKAKDLMQTDGLTIKQIGNMVGYTNDVTFNRVFKKYEGISPGRYKSSKYTIS